jgi:hypothetical protein
MKLDDWQNRKYRPMGPMRVHELMDFIPFAFIVAGAMLVLTISVWLMIDAFV